jgi:prepilin-type N-terminal cleavage/methylation domain-containing protein
MNKHGIKGIKRIKSRRALSSLDTGGPRNPLQSGFTLIEMLLYMGIFSILLLVLMQILTGILSVKAESESTSSVAQDQAYIMNRLAYAIHRASLIETPTLGDSGSTLHLTGNGFDETYTTQDNTLVMTDATTGITDAVSGYDTNAAVTFRTYGNTEANSKLSVSVALTLTSKTMRYGQRQETKRVNTTIQTR